MDNGTLGHCGFNCEKCMVNKITDCKNLSIKFDKISCQDNGILEQELNQATCKIHNELKNELMDKKWIIDLVAHDMKNTVGNIASLIDFIPTEDIPQTSLKNLTLIKSLSQRAMKLIRNVLEANKYYTNQIYSGKSLCNIKQMLKITEDVIRFEAEKKNVKTIFNYCSEDLYLEIHEDVFNQIFENILLNSLKFTPENGFIEVNLQNDTESIIFQIKDSGIGIPQDTLTHIFSKQSSNYRKGLKGEASTGLGLFIVEKLVKTHNGTINIESKENYGTQIMLKFPLTAC